MPNQMTARSAHRVLIATVVCCVFLLSGCGLSTPLAQYLAVKNQSQSHQQAASSQANQPKTLGEVLEAGTGTFDPTDPSFEIFDPCTEVTKEQYAQFGLAVWDASHTVRKDFAACGINPIDQSSNELGFTISTDVVTYEHIESLGFIVDQPSVELPENWYFHKFAETEDDLECTVAFSTNRGRISLTANGTILIPGLSKPIVCQKAVERMQEILALKGELHVATH